MLLGWMHSSGKLLVPFGECLYLRASLSQFRQGDFWNRKIADATDKLGDIYIDRRTYAEQIAQAKREKVQQLLVNIHDHKNDPFGCRRFTTELATYLHQALPGVEVIIGGPNEPTENVWPGLYHNFIEQIIDGIRDANLGSKTKVSVGNESSANHSFWEDVIRRWAGKVDYFDFHTSNSGSNTDLTWILNMYRPSTPFLNSEHYLYTLSLNKGLDSTMVTDLYISHLRRMKDSGKVVSVFCQFPSLYQKSKYWKELGLRLMDSDLNITHVSRTYHEIKKWWDTNKELKPEEDEDMKLGIYKIGSRGVVVEFIQNCLVNLGYKPRSVDGVFGSLTESAVKKFQGVAGLVADGLVGAKTIEAFLALDPGNLVYWALLQMQWAYGER